VQVFYANGPVIPLPEGHRFPASKYARRRGRLQQEGFFASGELLPAPPASDEQLLRLHTADYLSRMNDGEMSDKEMRRIGFPWSVELVERSRRSVGETIAACRRARLPLALTMGGGYARQIEDTAAIHAQTYRIDRQFLGDAHDHL
jgi:acetoin utilization deacetylase AcuC-like enzyme